MKRPTSVRRHWFFELHDDIGRKGVVLIQNDDVGALDLTPEMDGIFYTDAVERIGIVLRQLQKKELADDLLRREAHLFLANETLDKIHAAPLFVEPVADVV